MGTQKETFCPDSIIMLTALAQRKSKETFATWASANWIDRVNEMEELVIDQSTGALHPDDVLAANVPAVQKICLDLSAERRLEPGPQYRAQHVEKRSYGRAGGAGGRAERQMETTMISQTRAVARVSRETKGQEQRNPSLQPQKEGGTKARGGTIGWPYTGMNAITKELEENGTKVAWASLPTTKSNSQVDEGVRWKSPTEKGKSLDLDDYQYATATNQ